jgi:hypothetical protein
MVTILCRIFLSIWRMGVVIIGLRRDMPRSWRFNGDHDSSSKGRRSWNTAADENQEIRRLFMESPYQNYKVSCISDIGSLIESANTALENI